MSLLDRDNFGKVLQCGGGGGGWGWGGGGGKKGVWGGGKGGRGSLKGEYSWLCNLAELWWYHNAEQGLHQPHVVSQRG